jgi:hypothetical protein
MSESAQRMALWEFAFISPLTLESKHPSLALPIILMSNKDYYHQGQQQQQYYPPQGATFCTRCFRSRVIDKSICHKGHRLVKATTLSSRSSRTSRVMVVSLAISRSRSLKRFMCTPNVPTRSVRIRTHAEVYHIASSPRPRRTVTFARRVWQVSACVVVRKVRGFVVTSLPYSVLTRLAHLSAEICACLF